jgi:hypothetical protein
MYGSENRRPELPTALAAVVGAVLVLAAFGWQQPALVGVLLRMGMALIGGILFTVGSVRLFTDRLTPLVASAVPLGVLGIVLGLLVVHAPENPDLYTGMVGLDDHAPGVAATAAFPVGVALARRQWAWVGGNVAATGLFLAVAGVVRVLAFPAALVGLCCGVGGYLLTDR